MATTTTTPRAGAAIPATVTFTNTGSLTWSTANNVVLGYPWLNGACPGTTTAHVEGTRPTLPGPPAPPPTTPTPQPRLTAPPRPGPHPLG